MIPKRTWFGWFTRRGRLVNRWVKAFAEPDPARSLGLLRKVWPEFGKWPMLLAPLWLSFVDTVRRGPVWPLLTIVDLRSLELTAVKVSHGSSGMVGLDEALRPLIAARDARGEQHVAADLLARIYRSPEVASPSKATIPRELARRNALGDVHIDVYVEHLSRVPPRSVEPEIIAVLARCLRVGFNVDTPRLEQAGELAMRLQDAHIALPDVDLAIGFHRLLIERDPGRAAAHLEAAYQANRADQTALVGLLAAWVRGEDHRRAAALAAELGRPPVRAAIELIELSAVLEWLDRSGVDRPPPATAAMLEGFDIAAEAGEWLAFAIGRLHLLEGDAARAAEILMSLVEQRPGRPRWSYHAAWSQLLSGDRTRVRERFIAARNWPSRWTIGCLLMDADPALAATVEKELLGGRHAARDDVLAARVALARRRVPETRIEQPHGNNLEEDLETLRTILGLRYLERDLDAMRAAMGHPAFRRLPLADQLLWRGLAALPDDRDRGRELLEHAADSLRYPRAALVLAVIHFEDGQHRAAGHYLTDFPLRRGGTDATVQLLRAWSEACAGDTDAAITALGRLAADGDARARYSLGQVYLGRSVRQAASQLQSALATGADALPPEAAILAECAALAAGEPADCARFWPDVQAWPRTRHPWARWVVALAALAEDPKAIDVTVGRYLVSVLAESLRPPEAAAVAVAAGLAGACLSSVDVERVGEFRGLLERLARLVPSAEVRRQHQLAVTASARHLPSDDLDADVENLPLRLAVAEHALAAGDRATASEALSAVSSSEDPEHRFCRQAANLLRGWRNPSDIPTQPLPDNASRAEVAVRVLEAAALADSFTERCLELLAPVLRDPELTGVVNLDESLPFLCAGVDPRREVPEHLLSMVLAASDTGTMDPLALARCAVAIREHGLAIRLWRDVFAKPAAAPAAPREEFVRVLCHTAAITRRRNEPLEAVRCLRLAARVADGCRPDQLVPTAAEFKAMEDRFTEAIDGLAESRLRDQLRREWDAIVPGFADAVSTGEESQQIKRFAQLTDLVPGVDQPTHTPQASEFLELATNLELEVSIERLLARLFPDDREVRERPGRHVVLERLINGELDLFKVLLRDGGDAEVRAAWASCLPHHGEDLPLQHALAALYRERALGEAATRDTAGTDLAFATMLWALLLGTPSFWEHAGLTVTAEERQRLLDKVAREMLALHATHGNRELLAGRGEIAGLHLRCLVDCLDGGQALARQLPERFQLSYQHVGDQALSAEISAIAKDVLDDWCSDVLRVAQTVLDDAEVIRTLPEGIEKNFPGGIEQLEPFIGLGVPVPQVLRTGLEWYNEWCYSHYGQQEFERIGELTAAATPLVDQLIPLCVKDRGHLPENMALSRHFMFRGFAAEDPAATLNLYQEALAWNPANDNARTLLEGAQSRGGRW